ncbi:MAG: hypothetical protein K2X82_04540 [Gemmataceae bacterium]|nr:hypothetical protein [Gemmataceae bacterium]
MNCKALQNQVLALPDPRQVPDALRDHLAGCPACSAWWPTAARLEGLLERLPVPPAPDDLKAELIDDLTAAGPVIRRVPQVYRKGGRRLLAGPVLMYAGGLAAAVLVAVGGWLALKPGPGPATAETPRHPLLEKLVQRNRALVLETKPEQRLVLLGGITEDLADEARGLARVAEAGELSDLAAMFKTAVADGAVRQAAAVAKDPALMPAEKRAALDGLATKLGEVGTQADRLAGESPPAAQPVLRGMADTARDGQKRVQALRAELGA